jgi:hypothetical protein
VGQNILAATPWMVAFVVVLCLYLYVRGKRTRK